MASASTVSRQTDIGLMTVGTGLPTPGLSLHPGAYARLDAIRAPIGAVRIVGSAANSLRLCRDGPADRLF